MSHVAKAARVSLGLAHAFPAELPPALGKTALANALPPHWRAYGDGEQLGELIAGGLATALEHADRRDLVVEILEDVVVVYPAANEVGGADALADLSATALAITDSVLATTRPVSPRGVET
ncbi:MAG: hypothetical protein SFX73_36180 [Kofleriaceae bacterium]|nr:hypothetical protein [Kofleriaceae bacterium]